MNISILDTTTGRVKYTTNNTGEYEEKEAGTIVTLEDNETLVYGTVGIDQKLIDGKIVSGFFTEEQIRSVRDKLLLESDWRVLPDTPTSKLEDWKTYRQTLRNITKHENFPELKAEDWPTPPE